MAHTQSNVAVLTEQLIGRRARILRRLQAKTATPVKTISTKIKQPKHEKQSN